MIKAIARYRASVGRLQLAPAMNRVSEDDAGELDVVMPAHDDCKGMDETTDLLGSPTNAERLLRAIASLKGFAGRESDILPCE